TLYDSMLRSVSDRNESLFESDSTIKKYINESYITHRTVEVENSYGIITDRFIYIPIGRHETVSDSMMDMVAHITYNPSSYQEKLRSNFYYHLITGFILILLAILMVYFLISHLTRPIRKIIDDIDQIAKGDLDHQIHQTGSQDFIKLGQSITILVSSLKSHIDSLKEKETQLIESEEKYRSFIDIQKDLIIRTDKTAKILYLNDSFCSTFAFEKSQIIGTSLYDLVSGDLLRSIQQIFTQILKDQTPVTFEHKITKKDGTSIWVQWSNSVILDSHQEIIELQSVGRNITKKKEAEIALQESEEKYRSLISNLPDYVIVHQNGVVLLTNDAIAQVLGYDQKDLIGTNLLAYVSPADQAVTIKHMQERMQGLEVPDYEISVRTINHSLRRVVVRASIVSYDGLPTFITVLTDITERKIAETRFIEGERRYQFLVEQMNEGLWTTDLNEITRFTNSRMEEILRYTSEEMKGKPFSSFVTPEEQDYYWERVSNRKKGISERYYLTFLTKYGKRVYAEVSASPSVDSDGNIIGSIAVITDITRRREAEQKIEKYTSELELKTHELEVLRDQLFVINRDLDRMVNERTAQVMKLLIQKDEFIMQLGHDLRTPLTPILGLIPDLIEQEQDVLSHEALEIIQKNACFIQEIADKSLKLAKMSSFDLKPDLEPVPIHTTVDLIISAHAGDLKAAGITIFNEVPSDLVMSADKILFHELIENLISNGIKYIQRKDGKIIISANPVGTMIEIRIRDNGVGLRADEKGKIFDVFYKSDRSRHDKSSTGLGLAICRKIVENHGGSIRAESPGPGEGTIFIILLPIWKICE
ncbi:MAG: PAS domain S-box protein, partial [Methanospirillum sp.]|uniref:PAS domain S-box protein n=1 Tax=Methanospirillum sp. TaxID=45200 RepID=UPI00236D1D57